MIGSSFVFSPNEAFKRWFVCSLALAGMLWGQARSAMLGALMVLAGTFGQAHAGPFDGTIWEILSLSDQDKVLKTLEQELEGVREDVHAKSEADAKAGKTLQQLLDDVYKNDKKPKWRTYSQKYAGLAVTAMRNDAGRFARIAGEASAGDYGPLTSELPRIGARVFAQMVDDTLGEMDLLDAQYVWKTVVLNASALEQVGVAFMEGKTDQAYLIAKGQVLNKLKNFTEESVAELINWTLSETGVAPGKLYVQVIAAEVEFIKWSKILSADYFSEGCLELYVRAFETTKNTELALDRYEDCSVLGGAAFAEREFAMMLKQAKLKPREEVLPMLEAYRQSRGLVRPRSFFMDLYEKRVAQQEAVLAAQLAVAQTDLSASADTFAAAVGRRLTALAQAALSEEDREELLGAAQKAIKDNQKTIDRIRKAGKLGVELCGRFDAAKGPLMSARSDMERLVLVDYSARNTLSRVPECTVDDSYLADDLAKAQRLRDVIQQANSDAQAAFEAACAAKDSVATASDQEEARQFVQAARDAAVRGGAAVEIGKPVPAQFLKVLAAATKFDDTSLMNVNSKGIPALFENIEADISTLRAADLKGIETRFAQAREQMDAAQRRARPLIINAENWLVEVRAALAPHRSGPMGAEIQTLLAGLKRGLQPAQTCEYGMRDDWHGIESLEARRNAWKKRKIKDTPDVAALETWLAQKKKDCADALDPANNVARPDLEIIQMHGDIDAAAALMAVAKRGYELCFAQAAVAYSDKWGQQPAVDQAAVPTPDLPSDTSDLVAVPKVVGIEANTAATALLGVGLGAKIEERGAADTPDKKPGFVHTASAAFGDMVPKGTTITLTAYEQRPMIEVPGFADVAPVDAQKQLQAVGLTFGGIALGEPAPSDAQTGLVYTSNPAHPAVLAKLSPVTLVVYGPPKVSNLPVPNLANRSVRDAAGILASYGAHFVAGPLALGPDRPEGVTTGHVHFTDPPAGQPVPAGTVVTFYVYPPEEKPVETLVEIPREIIGMPAGPAASMLRGLDNVFDVPAPIEADAAQDGDTPGHVQYSVPAAGTMARVGSTVQLYVFTEAVQEPAEVSMAACPDTNPDTSSKKHRIDSNNNPDDHTYLECSYDRSDLLNVQVSYADGKRHGIWLAFVHYEQCGGRILSSKQLYKNDQREKYWSYSCNTKTGNVYKSNETTYANGKTAQTTSWHSTGAVSKETIHYPNGKPKLGYNYNSKGEFTYCTNWDTKGNPHNKWEPNECGS